MELKRRMGIEQLEISGGRRKRGERESNGKIKIESGRKETKERGTQKIWSPHVRQRKQKKEAGSTDERQPGSEGQKIE